MFFTKVYSVLLVLMMGVVAPENPSGRIENKPLPKETESLTAYCTPSGMIPWNDYISGFKLADLDHLNQGADAKPSTAPIGYRDYSSMTANVTTGSVYPIDFNVVTDYWGPYPMDINVRIWIDKDQSNTFDPATELVYSNTVTLNSGDSGAGQVFNLGGNLTIPNDANTGTLRMRIASAQSVFPIPCGDPFKGEIEDYSLAVTNGGGGNPPTVVLNPSNPTGGAPNTGSVAAQVSGGTTPYTYLWSAGTPNDQSVITNLTVGTYTVTVTGSDGASTVESATLTCTDTGQSCSDGDPNTINDTVDASCNCVGTPAGGGGGGCTIFSLASAVVSDDANNSPTGNADNLINHQPTVFPPDVAPGAADPWTWGGANGGLAVYLKLGANPESIGGISVHKQQSWVVGVITVKAATFNAGNNTFTDGATIATIDLAGDYSATNNWITENLSTNTTTQYLKIERADQGSQITEFSVCTGSSTPALAVSHTKTDPSAPGVNDGSIDLSVSGGTSPYTFDWSDGTATSEDRFNLGEGSYTVTVTDQDGSTANATIILTATGGEESVITVNGCPGTQIIIATAGASTATATWAAPTGTTTCSTSSAVTVTQTVGLPPGGSFPIGSTLITYELADNCGMIQECSFAILVENPCPEEGTVCDDNDPTTIYDQEDGFCNCSGVAISLGGTGSGGGGCTSAVNVALNKPTSQKGGDQAPGLNPSTNAVDGTPAMGWTSADYSKSSYVLESWWEVDLQDIHQIDSIRIWNLEGSGNESWLSNYHVFVSDAPFSSEDLATTQAQSGVGDFFRSDTAGRPTVIIPNRTGRYLRVQLAGTASVMMTQFEVFGCIGGGSGNQGLTQSFEWDTIPTTINVVGDTLFEKRFSNRYEYLKIRRTIPPGQDGSFEIELLENSNSNGDWFYIGLINTGISLDPTGSWDPVIGAGVRSQEYNPGDPSQTILAIAQGQTAIAQSGGVKGDRLKVERQGSQVFAYLNDVVVASFATASGFTLQPVIYFNQPGSDYRFKFKSSISGTYSSTGMRMTYTKKNATEGNNGQINLNLSGAIPPFQVTLDDRVLVDQNLIDSLAPGLYKIKVSDVVGQVDSAYVTIKRQQAILWDSIPPAVTISNNNYQLSGTTQYLTGGYPIDADVDASIFIRLEEDFNAETNPQDEEELNLYFLDPTIRPGGQFIYGAKFNRIGIKGLDGNASNQLATSNIPGRRSSETDWVKEGYEYEIRLSNRKVYVFKNFRLLFEFSVDPDVEFLVPQLDLIKTGLAGIDADIKVSVHSEEDARNLLDYVDLKTRLDGNYTVAQCGKLNFKFDQEYAIEEDVNDELVYEIKSWTGFKAITLPPKLSVQYGANWYSLDLPQLKRDQFYTLEVTGNKGKHYYLRFQVVVDPDNPDDCLKTTTDKDIAANAALVEIIAETP